MPDYIPGVSPVDQIYLIGTKFNTEIRQAIVRASFSASTSQVSQMDMTIIDRDFKLLAAGMVAEHMRVDFIGFWMEIASIGTGEQDGVETLELKIRPGGVRALIERTGALVMNNVSPTQFVAIECQAVGLGLHGQPSAVRNQVARDVPVGDIEGEKPPSSWTTFQRLADELGYVMFEHRNIIYFGQPSWLLANVGVPAVVRYKRGEAATDTVLRVPQCSRSDDDPDGTRVSVVLPAPRIHDIGPGTLLRLQGVPTFDADYIVNSISYDLLDRNTTVEVDAQKPIDPKPLGEGGTESIPLNAYGSYGTTRRATKLANDMVAWALAQMGDQYVFGANTRLDDPDPTKFDCSSLVQWACAQVGVYMPRDTWSQEAYIEQKGRHIPLSEARYIRGALLYTEGHVAISLGDGFTTIEAMNSQAGIRKGDISIKRFQRGALVPDMSYPGVRRGRGD